MGFPETIDNFAAHHAHIYFRHNKEAHDTSIALAHQAIATAKDKQQAIYILASELTRIYRYENNPLKDLGHDLYEELLKKALSNIDWQGIAENFIEEITQ